MKIRHTYEKPIRVMFEGEDGGTGNVALEAFGPPPGQEKPDDEPVVDPVEDPEPKIEGFDHGKLAKELEPVLRSLVPAKSEPEPKQKQYTPEEAKRLLNIWEPDDDFVTKLQNVETTKEAIAIMRDAMTRQNLTMVKMLMEERFGQVDAKYSPLITAHQEAQAKAVEGRFHETYPTLADAAYKPVVTAVMQSLASSGKQFKSEREIFEATAAGVEALIKPHNPNFKLTAATAAKQKPGNPNALPVARPGAAKGGGATKPASSQTSGNVVLDVLGKVK